MEVLQHDKEEEEYQRNHCEYFELSPTLSESAKKTGKDLWPLAQADIENVDTNILCGDTEEAVKPGSSKAAPFIEVASSGGVAWSVDAELGRAPTPSAPGPPKNPLWRRAASAASGITGSSVAADTAASSMAADQAPTPAATPRPSTPGRGRQGTPKRQPAFIRQATPPKGGGGMSARATMPSLRSPPTAASPPSGTMTPGRGIQSSSAQSISPDRRMAWQELHGDDCNSLASGFSVYSELSQRSRMSHFSRLDQLSQRSSTSRRQLSSQEIEDLEVERKRRELQKRIRMNQVNFRKALVRDVCATPGRSARATVPEEFNLSTSSQRRESSLHEQGSPGHEDMSINYTPRLAPSSVSIPVFQRKGSACGSYQAPPSPPQQWRPRLTVPQGPELRVAKRPDSSERRLPRSECSTPAVMPSPKLAQRTIPGPSGASPADQDKSMASSNGRFAVMEDEAERQALQARIEEAMEKAKQLTSSMRLQRSRQHVSGSFAQQQLLRQTFSGKVSSGNVVQGNSSATAGGVGSATAATGLVGEEPGRTPASALSGATRLRVGPAVPTQQVTRRASFGSTSPRW